MDKNRKKRLAVLVSGGGSNLQSIIDATKTGELYNASVEVVISNKKDCYALARASKFSIYNLFIDPKSFDTQEEYDSKIVDVLKAYKIDLVILAGYLKILTKTIIDEYSGRIINIHPSLLPNYGGKNMYGKKVHQAVIADKAKKSGCTVHIVTEEIDAGPILDQIEVQVFSDDTPEVLAKRVLVEEHKLLPRSISNFINKYDWSGIE